MKTTKQNSFIDIKIAELIPENDPLNILFKTVDFSHIHSIAKDRYSYNGRQGYDPICLFKAILLIYLGFASSERDIAKKLRFDGRLAYLCGFSYGETPKHNTFHYFRKKLGTELFHQIILNLIAQCLALIRTKKLKLSVDSSHIESFQSDSDAKWGYKTKDFVFFGYKIHIEVTNTDLPVPTAITITPANEWDGNQLTPLTKDSVKMISMKGKTITALLADAGYDSTSNASFLLDEKITPYIAQNPRTRQNPIHRGAITISPKGEFLCQAGIPLCYYGREAKRERIKFRCGLYKEKGSSCIFKKECWKRTYGPTFYLKEDRSAQDILKAIRFSPSFSKIYKNRTTIERFFSTLKGSHKLEDIRFIGIKNISIHALMSIAAYLCRAIAGMKHKTGLLQV